jgi:hypothetical protein
LKLKDRGDDTMGFFDAAMNPVPPGAKTWASMDLGAGASGIAIWQADQLDRTFVVKKRGSKGNHYGWNGDYYEDAFLAWESVVSRCSLVVTEKGAGFRPNVIDGQGKMRGFLMAVCMYCHVPLEIVNVSEWRRCIKESHNVSWPKGTDRKKALAQDLVLRNHRLNVSHDEADAVLIGEAAMRMGIAAPVLPLPKPTA